MKTLEVPLLRHEDVDDEHLGSGSGPELSCSVSVITDAALLG